MAATTACSAGSASHKRGKIPLGALGHCKSSAIAIHKTRNADRHNDDEDPNSASLERMYDYATWSMYTRITNYRQQFPCRQLYTREFAEATTSASSEGLQDEAANGAPTEATPQEHFFDGEIFELEL